MTATPIYQSTRHHIAQYCHLDYTCYGHTVDQMLKGSNNRPQGTYTATDRGKNMKKGLEGSLENLLW
jgi:hypothetical protein